MDCDEVDPVLLGTCGTVINTTDHMDRALDGVPLGEISAAMNDPSPFTLLAFTLAVAKRRGPTVELINVHAVGRDLDDELWPVHGSGNGYRPHKHPTARRRCAVSCGR